MENVYVFIYAIVSIVITLIIWNKCYKDEYLKASSKGEVEEGMTMLFFALIYTFWPIICIKKIIDKIIK